MTIAQLLWITASLIYLVLGSMHLWLTFFSDKFDARNADVTTAMQQTQPKLTREVSMWQAWISFNATHSLGVMFLGVFNLLFATLYYDILLTLPHLRLLTLTATLCYLLVGIKYWFGIPKLGVIIATAIFLLGMLCIDLINRG